MTDHDPLLGTVVHEHRIIRRLGAGGMGQAHLAQHVTLEHLRIVIKTVLKEHSGNPELRARFYAEAALMSRLSHPNIVQIQNFGTLPSGELFFYMPYLEGRPLDEILRSAAKLGPHHVLQLMAQTASALQHVHGRNIVHRDLKPGNLFVTREKTYDKIKLLDFGISKDIAPAATSGVRTHAGAAIGTPQYMPCEAYIDAATVGPTADVFSLAVIIVEMLTGQLPWGAHPAVVMYNLQNNEPPSLTSDVPRAWDPILRGALSPDPTKRPPSARAFIIALANELPPLPPFWKSGAKIVGDVAEDLITEATPLEETVRAPNNTPLTSIPIYPALASSPSVLNPIVTPAAAPTPARMPASMPATVNARPAVASPPSSISGSSGHALTPTAPAPTPSKPRGTLLGVLGLGTVVLVTGAIIGVTKLHHGASTNAATQAPAAVPDAQTTAAGSGAAVSIADGGAAPGSAFASVPPTPATSPTATSAAGSDAPAPPTTTPRIGDAAKPVKTTSPSPAKHSPSTHTMTATKVSTAPTEKGTDGGAHARDAAKAEPTAPVAGRSAGSATYDPNAIKE